MPPLLDQSRVIHHQHRVIPAHEPVGLLCQQPFKSLRRPGRGGHEVVQLLDLPRTDQRSVRLHALALAGQQQAAYVERCPAPLLARGNGARNGASHASRRVTQAADPTRSIATTPINVNTDMDAMNLAE